MSRMILRSVAQRRLLSDDHSTVAFFLQFVIKNVAALFQISEGIGNPAVGCRGPRSVDSIVDGNAVQAAIIGCPQSSECCPPSVGILSALPRNPHQPQYKGGFTQGGVGRGRFVTTSLEFQHPHSIGMMPA